MMTEDEIEAEVESRVHTELERRTRPLSWLIFLLASALCVAQWVAAIWVVPKFEEMFKEMDIGELPLITRMLMVSSRFAWPAALLVLIAAVVFHRMRYWSGLIVISGLMLAAFAFEVVALFMPLITIMDRLSGAGR